MSLQGNIICREFYLVVTLKFHDVTTKCHYKEILLHIEIFFLVVILKFNDVTTKCHYKEILLHVKNFFLVVTLKFHDVTTKCHYKEILLYTENFFLVVTLKFHDVTTKCYDRGTCCRVMPGSAQTNFFPSLCCKMSVSSCKFRLLIPAAVCHTLDFDVYDSNICPQKRDKTGVQ